MENRQFKFSPKIPYDLVAERSEATAPCLQFPVWWTILKIVRTHFAACGGEGLAKIPNRNPELKNCQKPVKISARTAF